MSLGQFLSVFLFRTYLRPVSRDRKTQQVVSMLGCLLGARSHITSALHGVYCKSGMPEVLRQKENQHGCSPRRTNQTMSSHCSPTQQSVAVAVLRASPVPMHMPSNKWGTWRRTVPSASPTLGNTEYELSKGGPVYGQGDAKHITGPPGSWAICFTRVLNGKIDGKRYGPLVMLLTTARDRADIHCDERQRQIAS